MLKKGYLVFEFIILFFGVPLFIYFEPRLIHPSVFILPILIGVFLYLKRVPDFKFSDLIRWKIKRRKLFFHLTIVLIVTLMMWLVVYIFDRENLLNLPKANFRIWLILCILYPVFSAYGQEIIYKTFIYYRYRLIFRTNVLFILASSISFSFVHIVYFSYVSIILTFLLGLYLAKTWLKTRSVLLTTLLHGLFGDIVFTIGLGGYFWLDISKFL